MELFLLASSALWSSLVILIVAIIYYIRTRPSKEPPWEKSGIHTYPKLSFLDTLRVAFGRRAIHKIDSERHENSTGVFGIVEASLEMLVISDLDILSKMFISDFWVFSDRTVFKAGDPIYDLMLTELNGDEWTRLRNIITPAFTSAKLKRMIRSMVFCAEKLVQTLIAQNGKPTDVKNQFDLFGIDVIATTAFGHDIDTYHSSRQEYIRHGKKVFSQIFSWRFLLHVLVPKLATFLGISFVDSSASKFFTKETKSIIKRRDENNEVHNDFLRTLRSIAQETARREQANEEQNLNGAAAPSPPRAIGTKNLTEDEMIAQCVMFFVAGFATTSSTITMACFVLATHPKIQERVREEVDAKLLAQNGTITYDAIQEMQYLDKVLMETLRMYPQAVRIMRKASADYVLNDYGHTVHKGVLISVPIYAIHHDPRIYPDPETFNPERFNPEVAGKRHSLAFMGFGMGRRSCIGERFALLEAKVCIASIVSKFVIETGPKTKVPPELHTGYGLLIPKGIMLNFVKRKEK